MDRTNSVLRAKMAPVVGIFLVRAKIILVRHCLPIQNAWYSGTVVRYQAAPNRPGLDPSEPKKPKGLRELKSRTSRNVCP